MLSQPSATSAFNSGTCLQHASNPVTSYCVRCGRAMCDLCTFWVGSAMFCPECVSAGASSDERSAVTVRGVFSILLALLGVLAMVGLFALGASGELNDVAATALGVLILLLVLGGLALGLIARDGAARTGSMLPIIGVILNGALLAFYTFLSVVGLMRS